jgi:sugar phosphate isomerase/epimerase
MRWPLGVVNVAYGQGRDPAEVTGEAAADGFEHIDGGEDWPAEGLAVPVYDRFAMKPKAGCSSGPWPKWTWEETVERFRAAPGARLEPYGTCVVNSDDACRAIVEAVPGLRLLLDVGHVTGWGGDPVALLPLAGHVQLRQARVGEAQATTGIVDFRAILRGLERIGYDGRLSVEYFDLPDRGWPLDDPRGAARETAAELRALMAS